MEVAGLHIDVLRALADIAGAFAFAYLGQEWGHRQGYREALRDMREASRSEYVPGATPDRDSERIGL